MLETIYESVIEGDIDAVESGVRDELGRGTDPKVILGEGLIAAMGEIGNRFECQEIYVPEMLLSARAMKAGMAVLEPELKEADLGMQGTVVLGTAKGDLHDIGKNLVGIMLEGAGFRVVDLGVDIDPERFIEAVREYEPEFVGVSALLTTTMSNQGRTIEALQGAGLRDGVRVMVGGAPVTQEFADEIGADLYATDASAAARLAKAMLSVA